MALFARSTRCARHLLLPLLLTLTVGCAERQAELPPLPEVSLAGLPAQVAEHVTNELERIKKAESNAAANGRLAMVLHSYNLLEPAETVYRRARALAPDAFEWQYLDGVVLQALGRDDDAVTVLRAAENTRQGYVPLWLRVADLSAERGDVATSLEIYTKLVTANPDLAVAQFGLGQMQARNGNFEAAADAFRRAVAIDPNYAAAQYGLSGALRQLGDSDGASRHAALFEAAGKRAPGIDDPLLAAVDGLSRSDIGRLSRALEFLKQRKPREAALEFERVLESSPENFSAHINLIGLYGDLRQPERAEAHYEQALKIAPDNPKLYNNVGVVRLRNKQYETAIAAFRDAVRVDPQYASAWRNLGKAYQDAGRDDEALESYRQSVELDDSDRQTLYFYGRLLVETGDAAAAVAPLTASLKPVDARTPHYMHTLASAQEALGDSVTARATLRDARALATSTRQPTLVGRIDAHIAKLDSTNTDVGQ